MRHPLTRLGPVLWVVCACLLMIPRTADAGDPSLAVDFDGDHRPELIASDQAHIQVWTTRHKGSGFRQFDPRRAIPKGLSPAGSRRVDDRNRDPEEALTGGALVPPELTRTTLRSSDATLVALAPRDQSAFTASPAAESFSPRPPPRHFILSLSVAGL